jgi:transposase
VSTMPEPQMLVTLGVDTHADTHVAAALDQLGRHLGTITVATTIRGFGELVEWACQFGVIDRVGVEGTGCWGAGLARWLRHEGFIVVEVDRPNRRTRRRYGKSDTVDALAAARAVQSGEALGTPKAGDGDVEAIRMLRVAHRSAVKARTQAANQLHALVVTAPGELRDQLRGLVIRDLVAAAARMRPGPTPDTPVAVTRYTLRSLALRYQQLETQAGDLKAQMSRFVDKVAPMLVAEQGVNTLTAAALLVAAGDNPQRLRSEGSFAHLCGVAPLDASSGKQERHRLNRGGDRQANRALHTVAIVRMSHDERTKNYVAGRISEGKTKREAIRCLKRYIAREIYRLLVPIITPEHALDTT